MPDERDRWRPRTPPAGVRVQTAPPVDEDPDWDHELTPLPPTTRNAIARVDARVKSTTTDLGVQVAAVRQELREDVGRIDIKVEELASHVVILTRDTAKIGGQLDILVADRTIDRTETSTIRTETTRTELKIHEAKELSALEEAKKRSDHKRMIGIKLIGAIAAVWATIATILAAR